jgi:hypothetical protein
MGQAVNDTGADRIGDGREHDGQSAADMLQCCHGQGAAGQDDVRGERDQSRSMFHGLVGVVLGPAYLHPYIPANTPTQFLQALVERCKSILTFRVVGSPVHEDTNPAWTFRLLRTPRERPCGCHAAEQREEPAPIHSITSSAIASSFSGMVTPSALAIVRLMIKSNLVGCSIGRSDGFAPRMILST